METPWIWQSQAKKFLTEKNEPEKPCSSVCPRATHHSIEPRFDIIRPVTFKKNAFDKRHKWKASLIFQTLFQIFRQWDGHRFNLYLLKNSVLTKDK